MTACRSIASVLGVLLVGALFVGCDEHAVKTGGASEVVFDLRPLFRSAEGGRCLSVVDTLRLVVTDGDGSEQTAVRVLSPDETEVRIPVRVGGGAVTFAAEVRSNNGTRLYTGSASETVEADGFEVDVPLRAVDAVLKACPDPVPLTFSDFAYRGRFDLINRGTRAVAWQATFDAPLCDNEPCFRLRPGAGTVTPGDTMRVFATAELASPTDVFDVRIASAVGTLDVRLVVER